MMKFQASLLACAAATALLAGSSSGLSAASAADAPALVRVQQLAGDDCATAFYAQDLGYFKNAGLDVELSQISSSPVAAQAVAGGAAEVGVANTVTIAAARLRGIPLRFIAPAAIADQHTREVVMMVPNNSPYKTQADLNGKIVGVNAIKSLPQLGAMTWMDKYGGDSKTVKFVEVRPPEMAAALETHRIDAGVVFEPFATQAKGVARNLGSANEGLAPNIMLCGYVASDTWLATHADIASRFVRAIRQSSEWANAHHPESATILSKYTKIDVSVINTMARAEYASTIVPSMIEPVIQSAVKYGIIDKSVPIADMIWKNPTP